VNATPEQGPAWQREALRQQLLLRSLWGDNTVAAVQGWLRESPERVQRGLGAYATNGGAGAERALAAVFPCVAALMGEDAFALLARAYRLACPPLRGDLALLGEGLADFIAADPQLADVPYLADMARLEWLLDRAERAADAAPRLESLQLLAQADPQALWLQLAPGAALLRSAWPVVTIRAAHQQQADAAEDPFAAAREALSRGDGECAFVWRQGFKPCVAALGEPEARFVAALLHAHPLGAALALAGADFQFEPWLLQALSQGALLGATSS
jgi:hypothetical protein